MRKARSEEYWENIGTISIFGTPKATISASVFGAKKHFFRPLLFRNPFLMSSKNEKAPAICPFIGNPICTHFFATKHRFPALSRRNATPAPHFPVQTPLKSVLISLAPRIIHPSPMYYFSPLHVRKPTQRCIFLKRASSTFSDTARLGILSLWR